MIVNVNPGGAIVIEKSAWPPAFVCVVLLSLGSTIAPVQADVGRGEPRAQERRQSGPPPYDLKAEVTVTGTVIGTETLSPPDRPEQTILLLTVKGEKLGVFLGPSEWFAKQKFAITKGAEAQVLANTGFRYPGGAAVQPRTVKIGKQTLTLRDATGTPMWLTASRDQR